MIEGPVTFVQAVNDFFEDGGRLPVEQFKALTKEDREELRLMLIELGYDVLPLGSPPPK
jgi:hypothetical protein